VTCPAADLCSLSVCDPLSGCGTVTKTADQIRQVCNDNNACTVDTCANGACVYTPNVVCSTNTSCSSFYCNSTNGQCERINRVCVDGDKCTTDSCAPATGCVFADLSPTELAAACPSVSCRVATCPRGSNNCSYSLDLSGACACANFPCSTTGTFCEAPVCVAAGGSLQCSDLPSSQQQACLLTLANQAPSAQNPLRYCGFVPTNPCPRNTVCSNFTCNAAASRCDEINLEPFCPAAPNQCSVAFCNASGTGCSVRLKTDTEVQALCDDSNLCTRDICNPTSGQCEHVPIVCPAGDLCTESFCTAQSGCGIRPKNASTIQALCNDQNACTTDTCVAGACV